ncbi:MAG: hydrogenase maturation protease [Jatrophihabitans sp.]
MPGSNILVAGIGNIFFSDDGFGCAVAARLQSVPLPDGVRVVDYGIRGVHLRYDLLDGVDALVLVDAVPPSIGTGDAAPGTVVSMQIGADDVGGGSVDAHGMSATAVLAGLGSLGAALPSTYLVGCVPAEIGDGMGLSTPVEQAVGPAAEAVLDLVGELVGASTPSTAVR